MKRQEPVPSFIIGEKEITAKKQGRKKYLSPPISDASTSRETENKEKIRSAMTTLPPAATGLQIGASHIQKFFDDRIATIKSLVILSYIILNKSGGHSTDESKLMQIMETKQKHDKQKKYCQALQDQQLFDAKIKQEKIVKENQNFDFPSLLNKHI